MIYLLRDGWKWTQMDFMETHSLVGLEISTLLKGPNLCRTRSSQNNTMLASRRQLDDKGNTVDQIFEVH